MGTDVFPDGAAQIAGLGRWPVGATAGDDGVASPHVTHNGAADRERGHPLTRTPGEEARRSDWEGGLAPLAELALIYQHAPFGICVLDRELRYVRINDRLAEINGLPAADHVGRTLREVLPDLAPTLEPTYRRVLDTGVPILRVEVRGSTPKQPGVQRDWLASYAPGRSPDGQILGIACVVEEITDRTRAESEIRRSEERYRSLVDLSPDGIFVARQGRIVFINPAGTALFGASTPGDLIGRSPLELFHAGCHALIRERVE